MKYNKLYNFKLICVIILIFNILSIYKIYSEDGEYKINFIKVDNVPNDIFYSNIKYKDGALFLSKKEKKIYWINYNDKNTTIKIVADFNEFDKYYMKYGENYNSNVKLKLDKINVLMSHDLGPYNGPWAIHTRDENYESNDSNIFKEKNQIFIIKMDENDKLNILSVIDNLKDENLVFINIPHYIKENVLLFTGVRYLNNNHFETLVKISQTPFKYDIISDKLQSCIDIDYKNQKIYCILNNYLSEIDFVNNNIKSILPIVLKNINTPFLLKKVFYLDQYRTFYIFDQSVTQYSTLYLYNIDKKEIITVPEYWYFYIKFDNIIICKNLQSKKYAIIDYNGYINYINIPKDIYILHAFKNTKNELTLLYSM